MKKHRQLNLVLALKQYSRYKRKYKKLFQNGTTTSEKLDLLRKRILRLKEFILNLKQKAKLAGAIGALTMIFGVSTSKAQSYNSTPTLNPFSLTSVNGYSSPVFVDLDADGDLDMMAGDEAGNFNYFENTGSASAPLFASSQLNPFGLSDRGRRLAISFGDLDNDGDMDMIYGVYGWSNLHFVENIGDATSPNFDTPVVTPFNMTALDLYSFHPALVDLDGDLDLDIISGDYYGIYFYYENTGLVSSPDYSAAPITSPFGLNTLEYAATPFLVDIDTDGDLDLFSGSKPGDIEFYENIGTSSNPIFNHEATNPFGLINVDDYTKPVFVDLDADGDLEVMVGGYYGDFYYFETCSSPSLAVNTTPAGDLAICENGSTTLTGTGNGTLEWYDNSNTLVGTGGSLTTPSLTNNTTYYLQDNTACSFNQIAINVLVGGLQDPTVTIEQILSLNGTATASSVYNSQNEPRNAFDGDTISYGWGSVSGGIPAYLEYNFGSGNGVVLDGYSVYLGSQQLGGWGSNTYNMSYWNFLGYNGTTWDTLDTRLDNGLTMDNWINYTFTNFQSYEIYRIAIDSSQGMSYARITEMKFHEAYQPCKDEFLFKANSNTDPLLLSYQWKKNGSNIGTNSQYLTLTGPFTEGDLITCEVTSECFATSANATSNSISVMGSTVPDISVSLSGTTITAAPGATAYEWVYCASGNPAPGTNNGQTYTATTTGSYAAYIYNGQCVLTSACTQVDFLGMDDMNNENIISVYPNPNNGEFTVQTSLTGNFTIQNELGQVVYTFQSNTENNKTVSVNGLANGLYFITGENTLTPQKIIVAK